MRKGAGKRRGQAAAMAVESLRNSFKRRWVVLGCGLHIMEMLSGKALRRGFARHTTKENSS